MSQGGDEALPSPWKVRMTLLAGDYTEGDGQSNHYGIGRILYTIVVTQIYVPSIGSANPFYQALAGRVRDGGGVYGETLEASAVKAVEEHRKAEFRSKRMSATVATAGGSPAPRGGHPQGYHRQGGSTGGQAGATPHSAKGLRQSVSLGPSSQLAGSSRPGTPLGPSERLLGGSRPGTPHGASHVHFHDHQNAETAEQYNVPRFPDRRLRSPDRHHGHVSMGNVSMGKASGQSPFTEASGGIGIETQQFDIPSPSSSPTRSRQSRIG